MENRFKAYATAASEIQRLQDHDIPRLLDSLPSSCFHKAAFTPEGKLWRLEFKCNFMNGQFSATAVRGTPNEAFNVVRDRIAEQIEQWHETRFSSLGLPPITTLLSRTTPRILLVDDDQDLALATSIAFDKVGWHADVAVQYSGLHRKIAESDVDYILLDWNLDNAMTADRVFEKAIRLIDAFSDLREKFREHKPRIVTYSILDREQIKLPPEGDKYFEHSEHWQKPLPYSEVIARATRMMRSQEGDIRWGTNS